MNRSSPRIQFSCAEGHFLSLRRNMSGAVSIVIGVLSVVVLFISTVCSRAAVDDGKRPFTVKDSLEISYIVNPLASTKIELRGPDLPTGVPIFSPNREQFLLVTQRGVLATNSVESTIWLFERQLILRYVSGKSRTKPVPKPVATLRASSNTPVISEVRWLDPKRIAFLGEKDSPYQQLFIADLRDGSLTQVTKGNIYVSQYDMAANTIAYTTLIPDEQMESPRRELVEARGKNLVSLLYPNPQRIEDTEENELHTRPSTLHVLKSGREVGFPFTFGGNPLKLFLPTLAVSSDGKYLITVAPIHEIPAGWGDYQPYIDDAKYMGGLLRLTPGNKYALADENPWKASQYVLVNTESGLVSPLVDAPAGRGLLYNSPTKAYWLGDGRRAVLSNTFLPIDTAHDEGDRSRRKLGPALAFVDVSSRQIEPIAYLRQSPVGATEWYSVGDVLWDQANNKIMLRYDRGPDPNKSPAPRFEIYRLDSGAWAKLSASAPEIDNSDSELQLSVEQDLNHAPVLLAHLHGSGASTLVWDPNPQLESISMVAVSIDRWRDKNGNSWSGLLVLPPDYDSSRRYPLVIQLYGYQADRFFIDGRFTTGFAGRALSGKGIVVLQLAWEVPHFRTPNDGPYQIDGFESAIEYLSKKGLIDSSRVGVVGFSFSSYHLLYALTHRPSLFAAASFTDGNTVSYWTFLMNVEPQGSANAFQGLLEETNGAAPFGKGLSEWLQNAPGFNLDKVKTPLLISAFERGELISEWEIYAGLRTLNKPVDMVWLRKENWPHILVQPAHRYISQQLAVDWFSFWLKGEEDPDPGKADQYERWRELRALENKGLNRGHVPHP